MDIQQKLEQFIKEIMEMKQIQNADIAMKPMEQPTIVPKKMKRSYVHKNPEEVLKRRQANVLINNLSRAKKTEERYFLQKAQTILWRKELSDQFPHLIERTKQYLLREESEPSNHILEEPEANEMNLKRKRTASDADETSEEHTAIIPVVVTDLHEKAHTPSDILMVQREEKLVEAESISEPVYDGSAKDLKPTSYKSAIQKLFRSMNS